MQSGRLAQLVERLPYKQDVTGSSPVSPIQETGKKLWSTVQSAIALGGRLLFSVQVAFG